MLNLKKHPINHKIYCPICFFPFEYCKNANKNPSKCIAWLKEHDLSFFQKLYSSDSETNQPDQNASSSPSAEKMNEQLAKASIDASEESKSTKSQESVVSTASSSKQKSQKGEKPKKKIEISQGQRKGNKTVTILSHLEHHGIDLKKCAKKFANKFACGCSVIEDVSNPGNEIVVIQGEFGQAAMELLIKEHPDALTASTFSFKRRLQKRIQLANFIGKFNWKTSLPPSANRFSVCPSNHAPMESHLKLLKEFESTKEIRLINKVASQFNAFRASKKLTNSSLEAVIRRECSPNSVVLSFCKQIPIFASLAGEAKEGSDLVQVQFYIALLIAAYCLDGNEVSSGLAIEFCQRCINHFACAINARSLDSLMAKMLFLYSRMHELAGTLPSIRSELLMLLKRASLNQDVESEACLINLMLRNYISSHLYEVADKFALRISFPQNADSTQIAKYLYYTGKINAFKLNYSAACQNLFLAIRKSPGNALGFLQASYKLAVLVQLLMGEIPERSIFQLEGLKNALFPYFKITSSVRAGDISMFQAVLTEFMPVWKRDSTFSLVLRLRHNVIRAGVKKISIAYSRISLAEIQKKLLLETLKDAEYIVMKCIKDGIVDAFINHEAGFMQSRETGNIYSTGEPGLIFNKRINFCLDSRAESIKSMRFYEQDAAGPKGSDESELSKSIEEYMDADELGF